MQATKDCADFRQEVDLALQAWREISDERKLASAGGSSDSAAGSRPDLTARYHRTSAKSDSAGRRYRTAVRRLSECLRAQRQLPGQAADPPAG